MPSLSLDILPPPSSKDTASKSVKVWPRSTVYDLKQEVAKVLKIQRSQDLDELVLYFQNKEGHYSHRLQHLAEADDDTLKDKGVADLATIACQLAAYDTHKSKLDSIYDMWTADQKLVPDNIRFAKGGEPVSLGVEKKAEGDTTSIPHVRITNYSWVDDSRREVKVYVVADLEPAAVAAAGLKSTGEMEAVFKEQSFRVTIFGRDENFVLEVNELAFPIDPDACSAKLVFGKKITITLAKAEEDTIWHTLVFRR